MAAENLYEELKDALEDFKTFLDEKVSIIKPAIQSLSQLIPQITDLLNKLIELMGKLKEEINKLDVSSIPGLGEASTFTEKTKGFLEAMKKLLPDEAGTIDDVLDVTDVVSALPSLDDVKGEILTLIDAIVAHLTSLKPA